MDPLCDPLGTMTAVAGMQQDVARATLAHRPLPDYISRAPANESKPPHPKNGPLAEQKAVNSSLLRLGPTTPCA